MTISLYESIGVVSGLFFGALLNFAHRKPLHTAIYKHVGFSVIGYFAGKKLDELQYQKRKEKIQILEDYVRLHPEDFEEKTPKKYADVLYGWFPIR